MLKTPRLLTVLIAARQRLTTVLIAMLAVTLAACGGQNDSTSQVPASGEPESMESVASMADDSTEPEVDALEAVLASQDADAQARYVYRHPKETLEFFGIEPGMQVLEALPGGGWYSKILAPYLGVDGKLVGVDYDKALFPLFGFFSAEQLAAKETWPQDWVEQAQGWFETPVAEIEAFQFGSMPGSYAGQFDAVLLVRAMHNLARFEAQGGFLSAAMDDIYAALKPGGVVGVVQHMAPEGAADEWAGGSAGYLKKSFIIDRMQAAGLELVAESDINANPKDQPTTEDAVWRLPPTLATSGDNPELADEYKAIGESNRMTLLFRKPA